MSGLVYRPIGDVDDLVVLDATRRTYAGLSTSGDYWHLIQPARPDDPRVGDGLERRAGELVCTCAGGTYRGTCWRTKEAEAFEAGIPRENAPVPGQVDLAELEAASWFDAPAGAGEAVEAFRG